MVSEIRSPFGFFYLEFICVFLLCISSLLLGFLLYSFFGSWNLGSWFFIPDASFQPPTIVNSKGLSVDYF